MFIVDTKIKFVIILFFKLSSLFAQKTECQTFKTLSCSEKRWVLTHPFVAKKAYAISKKARKVTEDIKRTSILKGMGNGDQVDAFRHTYWMASLTQEIGARKARRLGKAHEKGNYKDYKVGNLEDGNLPDEISSTMDLFNNEVGINLGSKSTQFNLKEMVVELVLNGNCKIIKKDYLGNFLDCEGLVIPEKELKGKWVNEKCLVNSNEIAK